ncbi:hypothetical protein CIL05_10160 [Virgibacillus profundi]|uniref:CBS domain-containing protein n=1 Tax=Virgibacillus profundi TaxID=2024555 RepID=A0A2A2IEP4_9BACI|nr:CBS domain-containing protein [Virgibacillus profundi]PAV29724.1 hypothetical protein CIL05_10160 [Virgibacillus profundi]PXY53895.1 CBS domain-containing protein [Virgibacillus profundi]
MEKSVKFKNSEKFLTSFNRIEKLLKSLLYKQKEAGFSKAVKILRSSNAIVKQYSDDLLEFAELRNAIVHNKVDMAYVIAEPHDSVVARITKIENELARPKKVVPTFSCSVYTFQENDSLFNMLKVIHGKSLSKFPIYNGTEFKGLITQKGITNWIAMNVENSYSIPVETLLVNVLPLEEGDNYKFISSSTPVYEAVEIFRWHIGKGKRLEALLITKNGNPSEKLLGIITAWDILDIP